LSCSLDVIVGLWHELMHILGEGAIQRRLSLQLVFFLLAQSSLWKLQLYDFHPRMEQEKQHPFRSAQSDPVHFVFPLRIIAPPGTDSRLPRAIDAFSAFNAYCLSLNQQNSEAPGFGETKNAVAESSSPCLNGSVSSVTVEKTHQGQPAGCTNFVSHFHSATTQDFGGVSPRKAIINLLRIYHGICRNMLYEEEIKGKDVSSRSSHKSRRNNNPSNKEENLQKSQEGSTGKEPSIKGTHFLKAGAIINKRGMGLNRDSNVKIVGSVAGVEVGDHFYFRMELCCIGMHTFLQGGIDYTSSKSGQCEVSIATSIISSGSYNDTDDGEMLIYTGQGGRSMPDRKPTEDQKMERGNLALENSMKRNVPVRVIRGVKDASSPTSKIYTYDGLYRVQDCWSEKGKFGFGEFKFKLQRLPSQPTLGSALLKLSSTVDATQREGLCMIDISFGKDTKPICVVNTEDDTPAPDYFMYSTSLDISNATNLLYNGCLAGCNCVDDCKADKACSCFSQNGNAFAYLRNGILVKERGLIYECGTDCKCSTSCWNRSTQRAQMFRLEVFKTNDRGWGLRSWDTIPAGSFICEYTGKLVDNAESLHNKDFILDINSLPSISPPWGHISEYLENHCSKEIATQAVKPKLIIDSSEMGNAARFINHSCSPNVLVQCVLRNYTRCPLVILFAMDNIPPFKELTIDYGCNSKWLLRKKCLCKSADCRGTFCG
ncbi:hypothetical protein GOP47_0022189, partial [Adiantum capillus-veneris]